MKVLYFDCPAGISCEMIVGSLLDLGFDIHFLARELNKINLASPYEISVYKTQKCGICASQFEINTDGVLNEKISSDDMVKILWNSSLAPRAKQIATASFLRLLKAQNSIFNQSGYDSIFSLKKAIHTLVAISSCAILIGKEFGQEIIFSPITEGSGFVNISGNIFSVPEPVVSEILREKNAPINPTSIAGELITPDGAAVCSEIADSFSIMPPVIIKSVGYGAANFDLDDRPAVLRVISGETEEQPELCINTDFNMETSGLFFDNFGYTKRI